MRRGTIESVADLSMDSFGSGANIEALSAKFLAESPQSPRQSPAPSCSSVSSTAASTGSMNYILGKEIGSGSFGKSLSLSF